MALILLRLAVAAVAIGLTKPAGAALASLVAVAAASTLVAGRQTRLVSALTACVAGVHAATFCSGGLAYAASALAGASLSLLGPGAYSLDARLAGWRSVVLRSPPP